MKEHQWPKGVYGMRSLLGVCHLLVDEKGKAVLIDTGLFGEWWQFHFLLNRLGLAPESVESILLTHGHLDHTGNLASWKRLTGAAVWAHPAESERVLGRHRYSGTALWCGKLEAFGRRVLGFQPVPVDKKLRDGDELPFWGGLRVVHLPGHTEGHCGFYSERHDLLFSGDLFASYLHTVHFPPPIFNSCAELIPASAARIQQMNPRWLIPNHYDWQDASLHRSRFDRLMKGHPN